MADLESSLAQLIGRTLSSIEFVQDYLQLRFEGITLTVTNPLYVDDADGRASFGSRGFCDRVCALIGMPVTNVRLVEAVALTVTFVKGVQITISLRPEDYTSPEAVLFSAAPDHWWVV